MKIAVIGAGIAGVLSALELASDGHEVTVFDRRSTVAAEASFAHIGFISPTGIAPWVFPWARTAMLRQLLWHNGAWPQPRALAHWRWLLRWWRSCGAAAQSAERRAFHELMRFSQLRMQALRKRLALDYERHDGILMLLRSDTDLANARRGVEALRELGLQAREISSAQCHAQEPDLNTGEPLVAAFELPNDEIGNCRQAAHLIRDVAQTSNDVDFRFGLDIKRIDLSGPRPQLHAQQLVLANEFASTFGPAGRPSSREASTHRANCATGTSGTLDNLIFDAVVVCAGTDSVGLLRPLGLDLPLLPVQGYTATFALRIKEIGPRNALIDFHHGVSIARTGTRVRVAGGAELAGDAGRMQQATLSKLHKTLQDWYPGSVHMTQPQLWKGSRPALPDGPPVIGPSGVSNVWLNLGHGSSGWALACGSARLLADQIGHRTPEIDAAAFSVSRYVG